MWATVVDASIKWSTPCWEIAGETKRSDRLKWLIRLSVYETELERARKQLQKIRESTSGR